MSEQAKKLALLRQACKQSTHTFSEELLEYEGSNRYKNPWHIRIIYDLLDNILTQDPPSGKKVIIERLLPGSFFGDLGTEGETELFVEATTDSYVCSLNKDKFFSMISQYPELSEKLMKQLFNRLTQVEKRMSSVATDSAFHRIVKLLFNLGKKKSDDSMVVSEKFTHEELSQMLGISRQTVTTLINQLEKKGLIKRTGKSIQFNPGRLAQYAS